jgi:hypothetical protein
MQDPGYALLRTPLLGNCVNKGKKKGRGCSSAFVYQRKRCLQMGWAAGPYLSTLTDLPEI